MLGFQMRLSFLFRSEGDFLFGTGIHRILIPNLGKLVPVSSRRFYWGPLQKEPSDIFENNQNKKNDTKNWLTRSRGPTPLTSHIFMQENKLRKNLVECSSQKNLISGQITFRWPRYKILLGSDIESVQ